MLSFDFGAWLRTDNDPELAAGVEVRAQFWSRDPGAPAGSNLIDALRFEL